MTKTVKQTSWAVEYRENPITLSLKDAQLPQSPIIFLNSLLNIVHRPGEKSHPMDIGPYGPESPETMDSELEDSLMQSSTASKAKCDRVIE
jgi:hypothetical protein